MFHHELYAPPEQLKVEFTDNGKYYIHPDGTHFPSVTTVIGRHYKKNLEGWKKRIGDKEAARILQQAGDRGHAIHDIAEHYMLNDMYWDQNRMPFDLHQFRQIKPYLDKHVTTVYGIEFPLYLRKLHAAGTIDLMALWDGQPAIIDYKTSLRPKKEDWIMNYFVQASAYAMMATHFTGMTFAKIVVLMMVDYEEPQIFVKSAYDYAKEVHEVFINARLKTPSSVVGSMDSGPAQPRN